MTCGSDEAFQHRDMRRIKRRMKYLRRKQAVGGGGGGEKKPGSFVELPNWVRSNGKRKKTSIRSTNLEYYCTFCGIVHYNDPIQVRLFYVFCFCMRELLIYIS
jgi:hypothetical protein